MACRIMALCGRMPEISAPTRACNFDQEEFVVGQWTGLVQNAFGHKNLSHIVNAGGVNQIEGFLREAGGAPGR